MSPGGLYPWWWLSSSLSLAGCLDWQGEWMPLLLILFKAGGGVVQESVAEQGIVKIFPYSRFNCFCDSWASCAVFAVIFTVPLLYEMFKLFFFASPRFNFRCTPIQIQVSKSHVCLRVFVSHFSFYGIGETLKQGNPRLLMYHLVQKYFQYSCSIYSLHKIIPFNWTVPFYYFLQNYKMRPLTIQCHIPWF